MNTVFQDHILQKARSLWDHGQLSQAGGVIFECIPVGRRHAWAYDILKLAYPHFSRDPRIDTVLEFAKHPEKWGEGKTGRHNEAHRMVNDVNHVPGETLLFRLAAQVGKIVYTSQQYPAPFDHSAGWKIAEVLKQIVRQIGDPEFEARAWDTLANPDFIVLEEPVMCHPACPVCQKNGLTPRKV